MATQAAAVQLGGPYAEAVAQAARQAAAALADALASAAARELLALRPLLQVGCGPVTYTPLQYINRSPPQLPIRRECVLGLPRSTSEREAEAHAG